MKKHALITVLTLFSFVFCQGQINQHYSKNELSAAFNNSDILSTIGSPELVTSEKIDALLGFGLFDKISLVSDETDIHGSRLIEFEQFRNNILVDGSAIKVLYAINNQLVSISGTWFTGISLETSPTLSENEVINKIEHSATLNPKSDFSVKPVWKIENTEMHLFWKMEFKQIKSSSVQVFIKDQTGEEAYVYNLDVHCEIGQVKTTNYGLREFNCSLSDSSSYTLITCDSTLSKITVLDNHFNEFYELDYATVSELDSNNWSDDPTSIFAATTFWAINRHYQFLKTSFGRKGWANSDLELDAYINAEFSGNGYNAAFIPLDQVIVFGSGFDNNDAADDINTLDVTGHELSHAIDHMEGQLIYDSESGALDESFADIFGEALEHNVLGVNDWTVGGELGGLRSMSNPEEDGNPSYYGGTDWEDYADVHYNSGVQNHFFYILSTGGSGINDGTPYSVSPIEIVDATKLAYKVLTDLVTPETDYATVRDLWLDAALSLFPNNLEIYAAVEASWCAVGVGTTCEGLGIANEIVKSSSKLYPNPTTGKVYFENANNAIKSISILSVNGMVLKKVIVGANTSEIDVTALPSGLYLVQITDEDLFQTFQTIVKQ